MKPAPEYFMKKRVVTVQGTLQMLTAVSSIKFAQDTENYTTQDYLLVGSLYSKDPLLSDAIFDAGKIWKWEKTLRLPIELEKKWEMSNQHEKSEIVKTVKKMLEIDDIDECFCCRTEQPINEIATHLTTRSKVVIYGDGPGAVDWSPSPSCRVPDVAYLLLPYELRFRSLKRIAYQVIPKTYFTWAVDQYIQKSSFFKSAYDYISNISSQYRIDNSILFLTIGIPLTQSSIDEVNMHYETIRPFLGNYDHIFIKVHPRMDITDFCDLLAQKLNSHSVSIFDFSIIPHTKYIPIEVLLKIMPFKKVQTFISSAYFTLPWLYGTETFLTTKETLLSFSVNRTVWREINLEFLEIYPSILKNLANWNGQSPLYTYPFSKFFIKKAKAHLSYYHSIVKKLLNKVYDMFLLTFQFLT